MKVNVIRHLAFEDLGSFTGVLEEFGAEIRYFEAGMDELTLIEPDTDDLLIILGGPISVNDEQDYPFLRTEITLLQQRLALDKPTLGICLGAQLMAKALGARVYSGEVKEIGWFALSVNRQGRSAGLGELDEANTRVLHWHGETFDIPEGAVNLASSERYENQAFIYRKRALALQFHPEVTVQGLERWYIGHTGEINATPDVSVQQLRAAAQQNAETLSEHASEFFRQWLQRVIF